jgi:mRNA-degrading endonuclease toxin of MazEF toxin-antitoxin module
MHAAEARGSEQFRTRPYVIVSTYAINKVLNTVVGVPLSLGGNPDDSRGYRIFIPKTEIIGCAKPMDCIAKCDQVRSFDVAERAKSKYGNLSTTALAAVQGGLVYLLNLR